MTTTPSHSQPDQMLTPSALGRPTDRAEQIYQQMVDANTVLIPSRRYEGTTEHMLDVYKLIARGQEAVFGHEHPEKIMIRLARMVLTSVKIDWRNYDLPPDPNDALLPLRPLDDSLQLTITNYHIMDGHSMDEWQNCSKGPCRLAHQVHEAYMLHLIHRMASLPLLGKLTEQAVGVRLADALANISHVFHIERKHTSEWSDCTTPMCAKPRQVIQDWLATQPKAPSTATDPD